MRESASWPPYGPEGGDAGAFRAGRAAAERGHLLKPEFLTIARWKSPRPTPAYKRNSEERVVAVSREAFTSSNGVEQALILTELEGVRVRTATAILHACFPNRLPVLVVRAMVSLGVPAAETATWDDVDWLRARRGYVPACRELARAAGVRLRTLDRALRAFDKHRGP